MPLLMLRWTCADVDVDMDVDVNMDGVLMWV